jgi:hypothetical protein
VIEHTKDEKRSDICGQRMIYRRMTDESGDDSMTNGWTSIANDARSGRPSSDQRTQDNRIISTSDITPEMSINHGKKRCKIWLKAKH